MIRLGYKPETDFYRLLAGVGFDYLEVAPENLWSVHLIGAPGDGKSTCLANLAKSCHEAGEGVLVVDPKGDLADDIAARMPTDQIVYCAPGKSPNRFWSLNPFEFDRDHPDKTSLTNIVAGNVVKTFEHIGRFDRNVMTLVRTYLNAAVRLALAEPEPTLIDAMMILLDKDYRDHLIAKTVYPQSKIFWKDFEDLTAREQRAEMRSTKNRLWDFIWSPFLSYWISSYESTFKLMDWLDQGKMVVCNFGTKLDETDGESLGNLVVSKFVTEYRLRESGITPYDRSRRYRIIVDEFHDLSPAPFARIITHGRAFNVFPIVAHQDMDQLRDYPKLQNAVTQARTKVRLYTSSADRATLAREEGPEVAERVRSLVPYRAEVEVRGPRGTEHHTLRLINWWAERDPELLAAAESSQDRYTRDRRELPSLNDRYERWLGHGTKEGHDRRDRAPNRTNRRPQEAPPPPWPDPLQPRAGRTLPDGDDSAGVGDAGQSQPFSFLDLAPGGPAPLSGTPQPQGGNPLGRRRPKGRQ